jgi:hypothetical protein
VWPSRITHLLKAWLTNDGQPPNRPSRWAKLYQQGKMKDEDPRRQYVKKKDNHEGFLDLKGFYRAVNSEMQAIKKMKPID